MFSLKVLLHLFINDTWESIKILLIKYFSPEVKGKSEAKHLTGKEGIKFSKGIANKFFFLIIYFKKIVYW